MTALEISIRDGSSEDDRLRQLAGAASRGQLDAFAELTARIRDRIVAWAWRLNGDRDEAEDVAQEVLLKLYQHSAQFQGKSRFATWLYRLTRNAAQDRIVMAKRRNALLERFGDSRAISEPADGVTPPTADDITRLVDAYRHDLSPRQQQVFDLVDLHGVTTDQVAAELGIAPATVRVLLARARRAIRLRMLAAHPELLEDYRDEL